MKHIRRILVPIDFSAHSVEALDWAMDLARRYDASITLAHVYQPISMVLPEGYVLQSAPALAQLLGQIGDELDAQKLRAQTLSPGIAVKTELLQGAPFVEIIAFARKGDFDLIIMGTHGRSGLKHALLGSQAEKVVRKAPCPVLTIRLAEQTFEHP